MPQHPLGVVVEGQADRRVPQRASIIELFKPTLYYLTPVLIAPRVMVSGVKLR